MTVGSRTVTSLSWNISSSILKVLVLFVRSVLLARLLPVEAFGIYTFVSSIILLTSVFASFGMGGAFLHRAPETEDEEQAAAIHFTLKLMFTVIWALLLGIGAFAFTTGQTRAALLSLTVITAGLELAQTPQLILMRRVAHRRLALIQLINALLSTVVALVLAWNGFTLWALVATDVCTLVLTLGALYLWRPVWRPRLAWSPAAVRYFLHFGSRNVVAVTLMYALDRVDDLWTGIWLGKVPLGYYSRAYTFATYPRRVLATPIGQVTGGTYAELKQDRRRLSQAFFRTNALLVRTGFYLGGLLSLLAPEFIRLLLGVKWLPMLEAFRLMLVYTLLDPIKLTVADLFIAVGKPEKIVRARSIQLMVMVAGLFFFGPRWGIAGVALAVDAMLMVGLAILLWQARVYVDFSLAKLFGPPSVGLFAALASASLACTPPSVASSDWRTAGVKLVVFSLFYGGLLVLWERRAFRSIFESVRLLVRSQSESSRTKQT